MANSGPTTGITSQTVAGQSQGAGTPASTGRSRVPRAAKTGLQHGEATLRVYPINEDALENLGTLNRDFSLLFAASAGFGGFALDLTKDLFLTAPEDAERLAYAAGVNAVCWIVSVGLALAAGSKWVEKGARMKKLKENVTFAE